MTHPLDRFGPEAISDPALVEAVRVNLRINAMREALGDDCTHELTPRLLAGIAAKPEVCDRVMRALARACWPDDPSPLEEQGYVAGCEEGR